MPTAITVHHGAHVLHGETQEGESWAAAARRIGYGDVVARDLTGEVKVFAREEWPWVGLRPMTRGDLPALTAWLAADHVRRWFESDGVSGPEAVAAYYGPAIDGDDPTRLWVVEVNGRSVGMIQDYLVGDEPDTATTVPVGPDARACDYLLGEPAWVGRGLGTRMLWVWAQHVHRRHPETATLFAAPDHRNERSLRALARVGFVAGTWFDEAQADGSTRTLVGCTLDVARVLA